MNAKKIFNIMVILILSATFLSPNVVARAGTQVESCEPFASAGTPFFSYGEVHANSSMYCQTGVSTGVTFYSTIKVFRKSDHVWLYDTITQSSSCTAPCSAYYDPNLAYNSSYSYYTWVRVTVNGSSQYDTDASGWFNY